MKETTILRIYVSPSDTCAKLRLQAACIVHNRAIQAARGCRAKDLVKESESFLEQPEYLCKVK
jgi:hypothetical protein